MSFCLRQHSCVLHSRLLSHARRRSQSRCHSSSRVSPSATTHCCSDYSSSCALLTPSTCGPQRVRHTPAFRTVRPVCYDANSDSRKDSHRLMRCPDLIHLTRRRCCSYADPHRTVEKNSNSITDYKDDDADGMDEDEDELGEYEALLLNAQSSHDTRAAGHESSHAMTNSEVHNHTEASPVYAATRSAAAAAAVGEVTTRVDDVIAQVRALLPPDGTPVRLTALTPRLDVEAISELYGSLLSFLQIFPAHFACHSRSEPLSTASASSAAALPPSAAPRWFVARRAANDPTAVPHAPHAHCLPESNSEPGALYGANGYDAAEVAHSNGECFSDDFAHDALEDICGRSGKGGEGRARVACHNGACATRNDRAVAARRGPDGRRWCRRLQPLGAQELPTWPAQSPPCRGDCAGGADTMRRGTGSTIDAAAPALGGNGAADSDSAAASQWWANFAHDVLPAGRSIATVHVRERLPREVRASWRAAGVGFRRVWRQWHRIASAHVELSQDGVRVARSGVLAAEGVPLWRGAMDSSVDSGASAAAEGSSEPCDKERFGDGRAQSTAPSAEPHVDADGYSTIPWHVELDLDDDDGDDAHEPPDGEAAAAAARYDDEQEAEQPTPDEKGETTGGEVDAASYARNGVRLPELNWSRLVHAPPAPLGKQASNPTTTAPRPVVVGFADSRADAVTRDAFTATRGGGGGSGKNGATRESARARRTGATQPDDRKSGNALGEEALLAAHTTLAVSRGWYTPADLLPLFAECVPTFYVPQHALMMSDQLAKIFGPHAGMDVLTRLYRYYFDHDRATRRTRLRWSAAGEAGYGDADRYYPSWRPHEPAMEAAHTSVTCARTEGKTADATAATARARATLHTPPSSALCGSAKTSAFPVLRPTIISKVKQVRLVARPPVHTSAPTTTASPPTIPTGVGATDALCATQAEQQVTSLPNAFAWRTDDTPHAAVAEAAVAARPRRSCSSGCPTAVNKLDYPFGGEDVMQWPLYARAVCVLPYTHFVPLSDAARVCGVSIDAMHTLLDAESEAQAIHAAFLVRGVSVPDRAPCEIRVRPYWMNPNSPGGGSDRVCASEPDVSLRACEKDVLGKIRPTWTPITKLWTKLTDETRAHMARTIADGRNGLEHGSVRGACSTRMLPLLAGYLRDLNDAIWVDTCGTRVRRYTGCADLDDMAHLCLPLLRRCSAHEWTAWSEVTTHAKMLSQKCYMSLKQKSDNSVDTCTTNATDPSATGLAGQLTHTGHSCLDTPQSTITRTRFLRAHERYIEVDMNADGSVARMRRRTCYTPRTL